MAEDYNLKPWKPEERDIMIFRYLKNCQPQILYPTKISFRNEEEIKTFSDEVKQRKFVTSRHTIEGRLEEVLQTERKC